MECEKVLASDEREDGPMRTLSRSLRRWRWAMYQVRHAVPSTGGGTQGRRGFLCGPLRRDRIRRTARAAGCADVAAAPKSRAVDLGGRRSHRGGGCCRDSLREGDG